LLNEIVGANVEKKILSGKIKARQSNQFFVHKTLCKNKCLSKFRGEAQGREPLYYMPLLLQQTQG
jgi:hypothetical protein